MQIWKKKKKKKKKKNKNIFFFYRNKNLEDFAALASKYALFVLWLVFSPVSLDPGNL